MLLLCLLIISITATPSVADEVWAEVNGNLVRVYHIGAYYQCAAEIAGEVVFNSWTIRLTESDVSEMQADCMCYFDASFEFEVTVPGDYMLEVWYPENGCGNLILIAEIPLHIDEWAELRSMNSISAVLESS